MKKKSLQVLTLLETSKPEDLDESDDDDEVQAAKKDKNVAINETEVKQKKPRTEKQILAFQKARETARVNAENRKIVAEMRAKEEQERLEKKIVQKAISIKKKEIKKQAALDNISDDDTPIAEIKKIAALPSKKTTIKEKEFPSAPVPKYIFI